jgi:hypothetical protein
MARPKERSFRLPKGVLNQLGAGAEENFSMHGQPSNSRHHLWNEFGMIQRAPPESIIFKGTMVGS